MFLRQLSCRDNGMANDMWLLQPLAGALQRESQTSEKKHTDRCFICTGWQTFSWKFARGLLQKIVKINQRFKKQFFKTVFTSPLFVRVILVRQLL
jgi:hypothetical protein